MSAQLPGDYTSDPPPYMEHVPQHLKASTTRLQFTPSYVLVGVYRLFTDRNLYIPAWKKCQHGFVRGATVGLGWVGIVCSQGRWPPTRALSS